MSDATAFDPGWSDGGEISATTAAGQAWWETTLQYVITSAANAKYNQPKLTNGQQYMLDQYGRLVPSGYTTAGQIVAQQTAVPAWMLLAGLAVGAVVLLKMVK